MAEEENEAANRPPATAMEAHYLVENLSRNDDDKLSDLNKFLKRERTASEDLINLLCNNKEELFIYHKLRGDIIECRSSGTSLIALHDVCTPTLLISAT
jgi:hypothetical protein